MKKKVRLITKQEVDGDKKVLGYLERNTNGKYDDLYYDFTMINGTHNSYHRDGTEWRTFADKTKKKQNESIPLKFFQGLYNLGVNAFTILGLFGLPKLKQRHINKDVLYEIDLDKFPSDTVNIIVEMITPNTKIEITEDTKYPDNAEVIIIKDFEPWIIITILGHKENLLVDFAKNGVTVKHFNERFSLNGKGKDYDLEQTPQEVKIDFQSLNELYRNKVNK